MNRDLLLKVLDLARWAPSGDNTQPWRFEIVGDDRIAIHGHDSREHDIYDFEGHASQMAHGALLETLRLAATRFGLKAEWSVRPGCPDVAPIYDVTLQPAGIADDPLVPFIETRCVQRRPMRTTPLTAPQKAALIASVGNLYTLRFFESFVERLAVARLLWKNGRIRLACPEAYPVHRDIIEWGVRFSQDRIPEPAVGVDPMTAKVMKWAMRSWGRVDFCNRFLLGTVVPPLQMDFLTAVNCASHILLMPKGKPAGLTDRLNAGAALQRLWLTASKTGLFLQPQMTPVIFRWYAQAGKAVSSAARVNRGVLSLARDFERIAGVDRDAAFSFFCRVGRSQTPGARSLRHPVERLLMEPAADDTQGGQATVARNLGAGVGIFYTPRLAPSSSSAADNPISLNALGMQ